MDRTGRNRVASGPRRSAIRGRAATRTSGRRLYRSCPAAVVRCLRPRSVRPARVYKRNPVVKKVLPGLRMRTSSAAFATWPGSHTRAAAMRWDWATNARALCGAIAAPPIAPGVVRSSSSVLDRVQLQPWGNGVVAERVDGEDRPAGEGVARDRGREQGVLRQGKAAVPG
jgi:hypothetical protein